MTVDDQLNMLKCLSEAVRLQILLSLRGGERCV